MKQQAFIFCLVGLVAFSCTSKTSTSQQENATTEAVKQQQAPYANPVLPGDYADPSVIRVGDDYWATATSSEWAPLFPILHSNNLVDWTTVGHVFPDSLPQWAEAHFWAPEITYEKGRFYIYYTAKKNGGGLCVAVASSANATGPFTDHGPLVCQEVGSIDAFEVRDEKGELYLIWKEDGNSRNLPTPLWGQRINEERTVLLGEKFELFRNDPNTWEGHVVEGPAIIRRGDFYYLFYAGDRCCGSNCTYGVGVARARSLKGPWEKNVSNPILRQNEYWKCPGHGTVVTDKTGIDYFMYHAYATEGTVYTGRQGLLDKIHWSETQWPYFEREAPSISDSIPVHGNFVTSSTAEQIHSDEFNTDTFSYTWQWPVGQQPVYQINSNHDGLLRLQATPAKIGTVVGKRTMEADYVATTAVNKQMLPPETMASLSALGDRDNAMGIGISGKKIVLWLVKNGNEQILAQTDAPKENVIQLKLFTSSGNQMKFAWSTDGANWNFLNEKEAIDASFLPPWDRGVRVGLTVKGPRSTNAAFDWFRIINQGSTGTAN